MNFDTQFEHGKTILLQREGSCQQSLLPSCINMVTNLSVDKAVKGKLLARKETWENCSKLIVSNLFDSFCIGYFLDYQTRLFEIIFEKGIEIMSCMYM